MDVLKIINHPNWEPTSIDYDFAMVKLEGLVNFCDYAHIRPICLPTDTSENYAGDTVISTGWGKMEEDGRGSKQLREVVMKVKTDGQCRRSYEEQGVSITSRMLCAGVEEGGAGDCQVTILMSIDQLDIYKYFHRGTLGVL